MMPAEYKVHRASRINQRYVTPLHLELQSSLADVCFPVVLENQKIVVTRIVSDAIRVPGNALQILTDEDSVQPSDTGWSHPPVHHTPPPRHHTKSHPPINPGTHRAAPPAVRQRYFRSIQSPPTASAWIIRHAGQASLQFNRTHGDLRRCDHRPVTHMARMCGDVGAACLRFAVVSPANGSPPAGRWHRKHALREAPWRRSAHGHHGEGRGGVDPAVRRRVAHVRALP